MAKIKLKMSPTTGDPVPPKAVDEKLIYSPTRSQTQLDFDVRDRISELVGKGNALLPDDKMAIFSNLTSVLGKDKAQKVMEHAYLFNSRPEVQKLPLEEKIKSFYTVGSNDPAVHEVIQKSKALGYGPLQGMRSSHSIGNQLLTGGMPLASSAVVMPEIKRKVVLKVSK